DLFAAGFVFALFASVYRKRRTAAVRFWVLGWFFVLLHFAASMFMPHGVVAETIQALVFLSTLILCGIAFVLSRQESHATRQRQIAIACLLGVPWLGSLVFAALPSPWFLSSAIFAYAGTATAGFVAIRWFSSRKVQLTCMLLVLVGCTAWLTVSFPTHDLDTVVAIVLTECFGLNAILLSFRRSRVSAATLTTSIGAVAWSLVWISHRLLAHMAPKMAVSPEIWNLPKCLVAAGMILTLLEEEIRSAETASEQYRLLFAGNPHPMWMYDPDSLRLLQVNDAAVAHYGFSRDAFQSMTLLDVFTDEQSAESIAEMQEAGPQQLSGPWLHRRRDGSMLQVDISNQPVVQDGRRVMFALMHDVTDRQRLHAQLMRQAHHDALTDLPNRVLFEQHLEDALAFAAERQRRVATFCIDLDRFKQINDSFGHGAGDTCLKEVATRILARLGSSGTLARSGGDEFMLVLGDLDSAEVAEEFASSLLRDLRMPVPFGNGELELGASVGFSIYPDDARDREQLWRDADAAMYRAKRAGGAQWIRVSDEISSSAHEANEIEQGLRRALKTGDLDVHYQPQMTIDGRLHSLEALIRSNDPSLKHIMADRLIAIAEESGLIVPLGNWVLDEVCRQARAWAQDGLAPIQIAVNVSPLQLTRFDFSRQVANTLERHKLSARLLEFEVTESTMMPEPGGDAPHQIATLARMGIRFSVDDFGTGYSSLGRLHQLPVDSLKIDRSFIRRIADFNGTYPTVEAIISLAHTFGMKVVAEGVEEVEQLRLLKALGCDRVQGFYFSKPLPVIKTTAFLQSVEDSAVREIVA
ncbi:MAG: EAL domain-containing protein, partial [Janthinobacterium lividum]